MCNTLSFFDVFVQKATLCAGLLLLFLTAPFHQASAQSSNTLTQRAYLSRSSGAYRLLNRAHQPRVKLSLRLSHPYLLFDRHPSKVNKGKLKRKLYIKVGLTGFQLARRNRAPVNLAVVLDRSGSMRGAKLQKAKEAAIMMLELLNPEDIFSLITYSSAVQVLVPATKVSDRAALRKQIQQITANGFTALFGGVSKGIAEVKKFLSKKHVNRVILLSDGLANVGPSSPNALGRLGAASAKQGISITTIGLGLGYNEDLMTQLALKSDGNHGFAKTASDLQKLFRAELGDVLSVVAQGVKLAITCPQGIRPVRVLDRPADIRGQVIRLSLNQLYSKQEKYILIEIELPTHQEGDTKKIASVQLKYTNVKTGKTDQLRQDLSLKYTTQATLVKRHTNRDIMIQVIQATANEVNRNAVSLRDRGELNKARYLLLRNGLYLKKMSLQLRSTKLRKLSEFNYTNASNLKGRKWRYNRKLMRKKQYRLQNQTSY